MNRIIKTSIALSAIAMLAACGGGGGGTPAATTPSTPAPVAPTLQTAVPSANYVSTEELAAYQRLNAARGTCGFGLLAQNANLDTAARGHANWMVANNIAGHIQTAGTPSFTGISPADRAVAANYASSATLFTIQDEYTVEFGTNANDKTGFGERGVRRLLNAPYHAVNLLAGFREVGFGIVNSVDAGVTDPTNNQRKALAVAPAYRNAEQSQLAALQDADVVTYPCQGVTDVEPELLAETPNPVPGRDLAANPLGSSITIAIKEGRTLTITSVTMTNTNTSQPVAMRAPTTVQNDPNGPGYLQANQAFVSADAPLAPNTTYQVIINGTNNSVPFTRSFTFTTGTSSII